MAGINFIQELKWRGLLFDATPEAEEHLNGGMRVGYTGFDPTAPSLHIGNLVQIMLLVHFQRAGHRPIALVGGATGMIGDPSGKSEERKLLSIEVIRDYETKVKDQLSHFIDFGNERNAALLANNYDWYKQMGLLEFLRDAGKHLSVNYMMAKDSVKNRLESGISFTEFSYQLLQGYDYYLLNQKYGVTIQMGGSDQWGNITAGIELTRKISGKELQAVTSPLITRTDGKKFGKTEDGNVWLDASMTSPYKFYQFWLNVSDEDAGKYLRIFTLLSKDEIEKLETDHAGVPHLRTLQRALADDITERVHSREALDSAHRASKILFGQAAEEEIKTLSKNDVEEIFEGVPSKHISKAALSAGIDVLKLMVDETGFFPSRGEARKLIKSNGVSVNKKIISLDSIITSNDLIADSYLLLQKGKKNYFLAVVE